MVDVARAAAMWERSLGQTCTVERITRVNVGGRLTETRATLGTYACRVQPASQPSETTSAGRVVAVNDWDIHLPAAADADGVKAADEVVVSPWRYQVVNITTGRGNLYGVTARAVRVA